MAKCRGCPRVVFTFSFLISRQPQNLSWTHSKSKRLISFAVSTEEVPGWLSSQNFPRIAAVRATGHLVAPRVALLSTASSRMRISSCSSFPRL
ncbi:unnamed protein product [Gulo gulo]|uniref:Uncharacterized protein n=1 Tax=Gulo gulo TaxID=48420 RepID=A0A9X9MCR3_GULGU|nr:unnamed protein product [Gulo gulo]